MTVEHESIERPDAKHCVCTTTGEIIEIDRDDNAATVETEDWGILYNVDIHYHCEGHDSIDIGHTAFNVGDVVVITAMIEDGYTSLNWEKITGFVYGPKPCSKPGVHLSGGYISGEDGQSWRPTWWDCSRVDALFGEYTNPPDYSAVYAAAGNPVFWSWNRAGYYNEAVLAAGTTIPDLEADEWELLRGPIYSTLGSLDGIAITAGCRLDLYCGPNYTLPLITLDGPGLWYTDGWNWDGWTVTGLDGFNLADYPEECIARHWTADAQAAMGAPQTLPHEPNGYTWGSGSISEGSSWPSTPPIRSLKIIDIR